MKIFIYLIVAVMHSALFAQSASVSDKMSCSLNNVVDACVRVCLIEKDPDACAVRVSEDRIREIKEEMIANIEYEKNLKSKNAVVDELMAKGMYRDVNYLIWMRCALGQRWDGTTCQGAPSVMDYPSAVLAAKNSRFSEYSDWRLPTMNEIASTLPCEFKKRQNINGDFFGCPQGAREYIYIDQTFNQSFSKNFPNFGCDYETRCSYFTSTFELNDMNFPGALHYKNGVHHGIYSGAIPLEADYFSKDNGAYVRLVRGGKDNQEWARVVAYIEGKFNAVKAKNEQERQRQEIFERQQLEESRRIAEERAASEKKFNFIIKNSDPQAMYLAAVKYESSDEIGRAKDVYLAIMERFSTSPLAIKAADRLANMQSVEKSNKAIQNASQEAERRIRNVRDEDSQRCSARINSCESSCFSLEGSSYGSCLRRCQSICSR